LRKNQAEALTLRKKVEAGLIGVLPELKFVSEKDLNQFTIKQFFTGICFSLLLYLLLS
jgi:hypothetical protein